MLGTCRSRAQTGTTDQPQAHRGTSHRGRAGARNASMRWWRAQELVCCAVVRVRACVCARCCCFLLLLLGTHVHVVGGRGHLLILLASEDVNADKVTLCVTVLAGLGGGHISDLCGAVGRGVQDTGSTRVGAARCCFVASASVSTRSSHCCWRASKITSQPCSSNAAVGGICRRLLRCCCCWLAWLAAVGVRTLQGRPLMTMKPFLRMVPACWG